MAHQTAAGNKAFVICGLLMLSTLASPAVTTAPAPSRSTIAERYLLTAANQDRVAHALPPLHNDPVLAQAALFHARQMAQHEDISHQFPGEPELSERGANAGARFSLITENVAEAPDYAVIHDLWMHSEGHRANLLDPEVNVVGISVIERDHQLYAVEDFASTVENLTFNQQESAVASLLAESGLQITANEITGSGDLSIDDARRTCSMPTGYAGSRRPWYIMRYTAEDLTKLPNQIQSKLRSGKFHQAAVGACDLTDSGPFTSYNIAILLYP